MVASGGCYVPFGGKEYNNRGDKPLRSAYVDKGERGSSLLTKEDKAAMPNVTIKDLKRIWDEGEHLPFQPIAPVQSVYLCAVQLLPINLESVGYFMLQNARGGISVPADRQSLTWGDKRFEVGEWIVLEWVEEGGIRWATFRHATEAETQNYGLS